MDDSRSSFTRKMVSRSGPEQGFPVRLLLPGYEGNTNVKWLRRIKLGTDPFTTRWETSKYTDPLPGGKIRQFSFEIDAKSIITSPAFPEKLDGPGWWPISGLAWSGRGRISRVDISVDGGKTWIEAELMSTLVPKAQVRFQYMWHWDGNESLIMSRALDDQGYVQPTMAQLKAVRGPGTDYHFNSIRAWRVARDGNRRYVRGGDMKRLLMLALLALAACKLDARDDYLGDKDPKQFGLGHTPTAAEIAAVDIDVSPNGAGLPAGSGTPEQGAIVFATNCATCHGVNGEGKPPLYPQLVGGPKGNVDFASDYKIPRTIGNYWPYATTLYDYIRLARCALVAPGSLSADQTYAVTAYLLNKEGHSIPANASMDAHSLSSRGDAGEKSLRDGRSSRIDGRQGSVR